jgi:hypothetical protein
MSALRDGIEDLHGEFSGVKRFVEEQLHDDVEDLLGFDVQIGSVTYRDNGIVEVTVVPVGLGAALDDQYDDLRVTSTGEILLHLHGPDALSTDE